MKPAIPEIENSAKLDRQCQCCKRYFAWEDIKREATFIYDLYWWNCPCGATLNEKKGVFDHE